MADRKIGYIGLGNMGGGMASHLPRKRIRCNGVRHTR